MKLFIFIVFVVASHAANTDRVKDRRSAIFNLPANANLKAADVQQLVALQGDYDEENNDSEAGELRQASSQFEPVEALKADSSNGRLFLKKFLLFGNPFGGTSSSTQPIIPIIITGTNGANGGTVTTTGTVTGTGTITTTPIGRGETGDGDDFLIGEEDAVDDDSFIGKGNGNRQQGIIKLKQGKNNQQGVNFIVPQRYLRYFQNNQNAFVVNPGSLNGGSNKYRKVRLENSGNIKRKRKSQIRRVVAQ